MVFKLMLEWYVDSFDVQLSKLESVLKSNTVNRIVTINSKTGLNINLYNSPIGKHIRRAFKRSPTLLMFSISSIIISSHVCFNASDRFITFFQATLLDLIKARLFWISNMKTKIVRKFRDWIRFREFDYWNNSNLRYLSTEKNFEESWGFGPTNNSG